MASVFAAGLVACSLCGGGLWIGCGGTTGRDNGSPLAGDDSGENSLGPDSTAPAPADVAVEAPPDAGVDATVGVDADEGAFDVVIPYLDRALAEINAPPPREGGAEAGEVLLDWPSCPPDVPDPNSGYGVAAVYYDAGDAGIIGVPAPDGSACATFGWLSGNLDWTNCARATENLPPAQPVFPPCEFLLDAGTAQGGAQVGHTRYYLCQRLMACIERTRCWASLPGFTNPDMSLCLCVNRTNPVGLDLCASLSGTGDAGPCQQEELAAMEISPTDKNAMSVAKENMYTVDPTSPYATAGILNVLWSFGLPPNAPCYADAGSP